MTDKNEVNVFFYGGYMNADVLAGFGIGERELQVVQLPGYQLTMGASANVVKRGLETAFGIVMPLTYEELEGLYGAEAQAKLGAYYRPEPVVVLTQDGEFLPALCYSASDPVVGLPSTAYVESILRAARTYNFPPSYIRRIESYKSGDE